MMAIFLRRGVKAITRTVSSVKNTIDFQKAKSCHDSNFFKASTKTNKPNKKKN
jgi:hypothetical protein